MLRQIHPAIVMVVLLTVITGLVYPLGDDRARAASLSSSGQWQPDRERRQSYRLELIGQNFTDARYFHGRPSATTDTDPNDPAKTVPAPYNASNSGGANAGPTSKSLIDRVTQDADKLKAENPSAPIPVDLVTTSASGLDPDISPGGGALPGAARGESEGDFGGPASRPCEPKHRRALPWHSRRAEGECASAQHEAGRRDRWRKPLT